MRNFRVLSDLDVYQWVTDENGVFDTFLVVIGRSSKIILMLRPPTNTNHRKSISQNGANSLYWHFWLFLFLGLNLEGRKIDILWLL